MLIICVILTYYCHIDVLPQALMADRLAVMCRFLSPETVDWNYNMVLWRSSQLYSCSFAYTLLSLFSGKRASQSTFISHLIHAHTIIYAYVCIIIDICISDYMCVVQERTLLRKPTFSPRECCLYPCSYIIMLNLSHV